MAVGNLHGNRQVGLRLGDEAHVAEMRPVGADGLRDAGFARAIDAAFDAIGFHARDAQALAPHEVEQRDRGDRRLEPQQLEEIEAPLVGHDADAVRRRQADPLEVAQHVVGEARHGGGGALGLLALQGRERCLAVAMRDPCLDGAAREQSHRQQAGHQGGVARGERTTGHAAQCTPALAGAQWAIGLVTFVPAVGPRRRCGGRKR